MCSAREKTVPNLQSLVSELIKTQLNAVPCHPDSEDKGELGDVV